MCEKRWIWLQKLSVRPQNGPFLRVKLNKNRELLVSETQPKKRPSQKCIQNLPEQFNTIVGDRGVRLSGGQRQRLFLARELYKNPRLLILDEATSALDSESEKYIQESIEALRGRTTVVIIAHRLSTIKNADYIYVLDKGRIIEQGSYHQLLSTNNGRFNRMVALQSL
jgi:ABC-type multidrug transport system fused ATPase/permease subunit